MNDEQFLALLAAVCACIPGRRDTTVLQDIDMALAYLEGAAETAPAVGNAAKGVTLLRT